MPTNYPTSFYEAQADGSRRSARVVLDLVWQFVQPQSVVDVGCGRGTWLAASAEKGVEDLLGLDGDWVSGDELKTEGIRFIPIDLEAPFFLDKAYDLCISMEVAEHLSPNTSRHFVQSLCAASQVVLFSAAIEGQGGRCHVNERPQSYWIGLFREAGYRCLDVIRPALWMNDSVEWWYRQNAFLFCRGGHPLLTAAETQCANPSLADVVHPELLHAKLSMYRKLHSRPPLRWLLGRLAAGVRCRVPWVSQRQR